MIALWMVYASVVAALLWGAGIATERVARQVGGAGRGVWVVTLVASAILPFLLVASSRGAGGGGGPSEGTGELAIREGLVPSVMPSPESLVWVDLLAGGIWLVASIAVLVTLVRAASALRKLEREWRVDSLAGAPVLVSAGVGPAVVGILRPRIVVPGWALDLDDDSRRLLLRHEREHVRAGDHRLLGVAAAAAVLFPWNPGVWLQLRRLREAVELDCDARVVRTRADRPRYGELLLTVAGRMVQPSTRQFGLAVATPPLERRIRQLAGRMPRLSRAGLFAMGGSAFLLAILVPFLPPPRVELPSILPAWRASERETRGQPPGNTVDARPVVLNAHEAPAILEAVYPQSAEVAEGGGNVIVWAYITAGGAVERTAVQAGSGDAALDRAAAEAVKRFRFRAGRANGRAAGMWTSQWIYFLPRAPEGGSVVTAEDPSPTPEGSTTRLAIWTSPSPA